MKPIDSNLQCPSCHGELRPTVLVCDACQIRVEGPLRLNEFASLGPEDLHFLRIFVQSEGRIRDMEAALGLSYPTIRTRLTALKHKLAADTAEIPLSPDTGTPDDGNRPRAGTTASSAADLDEASSAELTGILEQLESGAIPFREALKRIRATRSGR